jgi:hypothetical protein
MAAKMAIHAFPGAKVSGRFSEEKLRKRLLILMPLAHPRHAGLGLARRGV